SPAVGTALDAAGNVQISGAGNGLIFPDGTKQTTAATGGAGGGWSLTGNAGTNPASNYLGTTDGKPLVLKIVVPANSGLHGATSGGLRFDYAFDGLRGSEGVSVLGGYAGNAITGVGGVIAGGGGYDADFINPGANTVTDDFGAICG